MNFQRISKSDLDEEMLKFSLSLYNNKLFSKEAVDILLKQIDQYICTKYIPFIQTQVYDETSTILSQDKQNILQFVLEDTKHLFNEFSTEYRRFSIYAEKGFISPEHFLLGSMQNVFNPVTQRYEDKKIFASHISLKKTLKFFLEQPGVYEQMRDYRNLMLNSSLLCNVVTGSRFQEKYLDFSKDVYPINTFVDDFNARGPLTSHTGEESMCGVYTSLPCLPPHLVAKSDNIFLSTVCHTKYVKEFKNEKVFAKTVEDLDLLSKEGLTLNIDSKNFKIYFELVQVLGDNKALNSVGGFVESFLANHYCRMCYASYEECKIIVREIKSKLRFKDRYEIDLAKKNSSETGLKEPCVFNKVNKYHIYEDISSDEFHDFWHGGAVVTTCKVLGALIKAGILKLNVLISRVKIFSYNETEKHNKPRPNFYFESEELKTKQSAAEMLCLVRLLGPIIGDLIPRGNQYWELYLYLRQICDYITAPRLHKSEMNTLADLIQSHHKLYLRLFDHLTPKMHFWVHYPRLIRLYGPVIHYSSSVFERQNKVLKSHATPSANNLFLPHTISERHQLEVFYKTKFFPIKTSDIELGPEKKTMKDEILIRSTIQVPPNSSVSELSFIEIFNKKYRVGTIFISKIEATPKFSEIKNVYLINNIIFLQVHNFNISYYDDHFHAWVVSYDESGKDNLILADFPRIPPCQSFDVHNKTYISTRYIV